MSEWGLLLKPQTLNKEINETFAEQGNISFGVEWDV